MTEIRSADYFMNVGNSILNSIVAALQCYNLEVPDRTFVGFDRPPQDCCPELVGWITNVRIYDGTFPDSRQFSELTSVWGYAFDFTVRIGRCYIDVDEKGQPLDAETVADFTSYLYQDATAIFVGWLAQWKAGEVDELGACTPVNVSSMQSYRDGGCAGWEFTITVGTF